MLKIGKIVNTFGIKGELKVVSQSENIEGRFAQGNKIVINNEEYEITTCRIHKGNALIRVNNYQSINDVEYLVNHEVFINKEKLENDDELYLYQLKDLKVFHEDLYIGQVIEVLKPHQTVIRVETDNGSFLLPVVDEFVKNIDLDNQRIDIELIEGLQ